MFKEWGGGGGERYCFSFFRESLSLDASRGSRQGGQGRPGKNNTRPEKKRYLEYLDRPRTEIFRETRKEAEFQTKKEAELSQALFDYTTTLSDRKLPTETGWF
jgi:hypothetical protein